MQRTLKMQKNLMNQITKVSVLMKMNSLMAILWNTWLMKEIKPLKKEMKTARKSLKNVKETSSLTRLKK